MTDITHWTRELRIEHQNAQKTVAVCHGVNVLEKLESAK
jgi:hypothetical protein